MGLRATFYRMNDPEPDHGTLTITVKGIGEYDVEQIINHIEGQEWFQWTTVDARFKRVVRTDWTNDSRKIPDPLW